MMVVARTGTVTVSDAVDDPLLARTVKVAVVWFADTAEMSRASLVGV